MSKLAVEIGMLLTKNIKYYHDILIEHEFYLSFACTTHDLYYTKENNFENMSEKQIKDSCIRIRKLDAFFGENKDKTLSENEIKIQENNLLKQGYHKVFDTIKLDFQYKKPGWQNNYLQLQNIKDVGLLVYWTNPTFYHLSEQTQRKKLLKELNSFGFCFKENELGLDKLKTLYYNKKMYSKNQNA